LEKGKIKWKKEITEFCEYIASFILNIRTDFNDRPALEQKFRDEFPNYDFEFRTNRIKTNYFAHLINSYYQLFYDKYKNAMAYAYYNKYKKY
jgi:hypothetical protein